MYRNNLKKGVRKPYYAGSILVEKGKTSNDIFLFHQKLDFWKSEKNGEKRRKPAKIAGFLGAIY